VRSLNRGKLPHRYAVRLSAEATASIVANRMVATLISASTLVSDKPVDGADEAIKAGHFVCGSLQSKRSSTNPMRISALGNVVILVVHQGHQRVSRKPRTPCG
jgi:hypothetical protein